MVDVEYVTREEFDSLKKLVIKMRDTLAECNLKVPAPFDEMELEDDSDDIFGEDVETEDDGEESDDGKTGFE